MSSSEEAKSASQEIDAIILKFPDWRGEMMAQLRTWIKQADADVIEEVKWKKPSNPDGVPVWSHEGIICLGEIYKQHLRISFSKGSELPNPNGLINSYRAILIHEGDKINERDFKDLIAAAVELNKTRKNKSKKPVGSAAKEKQKITQ